MKDRNARILDHKKVEKKYPICMQIRVMKKLLVLEIAVTKKRSLTAHTPSIKGVACHPLN